MAKFTLLQEFRDFAVKGNALDMAVGVIIGGAFGKIVSSIVNDLIMPPIGYVLGGLDFKDMKLVIGETIVAGEKQVVTLNYGNFIQTTVDFLVIAFCVFMLLRGIMTLKRVSPTIIPIKEEKPAAPPAPTQEELLAEIRDLLKSQK